MWVTWGAAGLLHYRPSLSPSEFSQILRFSRSHQRSPPLLQYPAAKPLGLKIELINTFSKYKWDDCLLMDCLSFGSAFKESVWVMTREGETNIIMCCQSPLKMGLMTGRASCTNTLPGCLCQHLRVLIYGYVSLQSKIMFKFTPTL